LRDAARGTGRENFPPTSLVWTVWGLGAALYLLAFYHRVAPAVITRELMAEFGLSAAALGNLSAFYFYSYVAVQIPTGLLCDRWGPRKVLATGAALTALGTLLFALAPSVAYANAGRLAIGAAAGVAFVAMLKIASHWMAPRRFAFAGGMALLIGALGATLAGAPLRIAVDAFGWRAVMATSAALAAVVALAIWFVVRDDPAERGYASYFPEQAHDAGAGSIAAHLRTVLGYRNSWLLLFIPGALSGLILAVPGLWGVPFLVTQYGFTTREAAAMASVMLVSWSAASVFYGPLSERIGRRKPLYVAGILLMMAFWATVIFVPELPRSTLIALLIAASVSAGVVVLTFAWAKESVPPRVGGAVSGIANMGMMLGGMVMQPLIGFALDRFWSGRTVEGVRVYDFAAYQAGFSLVLAWGALSLVLLAFARETRCRQQR
jgi:MFS family permease